MNLFVSHGSFITTRRNSYLRLLLILLLVAVLPVFIWAVLTQRIELRKHASTSEPTQICWNRVTQQSGETTNSISTTWPSSCKGNPRQDLVCTQVLVPLSADEITGYHSWLSLGSPPIPGCETPKRINWTTPSDYLRASDMTIVANGNTFKALNVSNLVYQASVTNPPNDSDFAITWTENNLPMGLSIHFTKFPNAGWNNQNEWRITDLKTYDGTSSHGWISYKNAVTTAQVRGQYAYGWGTNALSLTSDPGNTYNGTIHFENLEMAAFTNQVTPTPTPRSNCHYSQQCYGTQCHQILICSSPQPTCTPLPRCATEGTAGLNGTRMYCDLQSNTFYCRRPTPTPTPVTYCSTNADCPTNNTCSAVPPGGCPTRIVNGVEEHSACAGVPRCWPITTPTPTPASCSGEGSKCTLSSYCAPQPTCPAGQMCAQIAQPCTLQSGICRKGRCVSTQSTPTPTPTLWSCASLYSVHADNFDGCITSGFDDVCFDKYSAVYQGCSRSSYNDCTVNNTHASQNIQCSVRSHGTPTPTVSPTPTNSPTPTPKPTVTPTPTPVACTRNAPSVSITPATQDGYPGDAKKYTVTIWNNDSFAGCSLSNFTTAIQVPAGWTSSQIGSFSTVPGSTTMDITVTPPSTIAGDNQSHPITVTATNVSSGMTGSSTVSYKLLQRSQDLQFLVKLAGVTDSKAMGAKMAVKFYKKDGTIVQLSAPLVLAYASNGIYRATATLTNTFAAGTEFTVQVKGEKHSAIKFTHAAGQASQCSDGAYMTMPTPIPTTLTFDFTGTPLPAGDTNPQDGQINQTDIDRITALMAKSSSALTDQDKLVGDLNYDGVVNGFDIFQIIQTLQTRCDAN